MRSLFSSTLEHSLSLFLAYNFNTKGGSMKAGADKLLV